MAGSIGFNPSASSWFVNSLASESFSDAPVEQDLGLGSMAPEPMSFADSFSAFDPMASAGLPAMSPMDMFGAGMGGGGLPGLPTPPDPFGFMGGGGLPGPSFPDPLGFMSPSQPLSPFGPVAQPAISSPFRPTDPFSGSSSFGGSTRSPTVPARSKPIASKPVNSRPDTTRFQPAPTRQSPGILDTRNGHRGRHSGIGAKPTLPPGGDW